jgi:hypothetical protein
MPPLGAAATAHVHFVKFFLKSFQRLKFNFNNFHLKGLRLFHGVLLFGEAPSGLVVRTERGLGGGSRFFSTRYQKMSATFCCRLQTFANPSGHFGQFSSNREWTLSDDFSNQLQDKKWLFCYLFFYDYGFKIK